MSRATEDLRLWRTWTRSHSSADMQAILDQLQPLIHLQVNKWSGVLSRPLLETQAKILVVQAVKDFNPNRGASLGTHVTNRLQKLSRTVYSHAQAARLPEHKAVGMSSFQIAQDEARSDLGREPTLIELSDHLGWSSKRTGEFQRAFNRRELLTSGEFTPSTFPTADDTDPVVGYVYYDLAPKQQRIFEHTTGYGGKPILSNPQMMKKFGLTQGQLSYQKRKITQSFHDAMETGTEL